MRALSNSGQSVQVTIRLTPATAAAALQVVEAERESARQVGFPATITLSSLVRLRIEREVQECSGSATVQTREHDATNVLAAVAKLRRNH
jgi:hypothetical protein